MTSYVVDVGLFLPEGLHLLVNWVMSVGAMVVLYLMLLVYMGDVSRMEDHLHAANNRFVSLVSGMFPKVIAERLLAKKQTFAERYSNCTVLFADIVGFTGMTERMAPEALVAILSDVFLQFDNCVERSGLTKIKTIGDAYMVATGVPEPDAEHARKMLVFAMQMLDVVQDFPDIELRIGIASGELVAGVIGQTRQVYDVWGDVVNLASRIESMGTANNIQVCETTHALVKQDFNFMQRSGLTIKGKAGTHNVYVLNRAAASTNSAAH
jgi:class 3 adenylate cyclase